MGCASNAVPGAGNSVRVSGTGSVYGTKTGVGDNKIFVVLPINQIPGDRKVVDTLHATAIGCPDDVAVPAKRQTGDLCRIFSSLKRGEQLPQGRLPLAADYVVNGRR